MNWLRLDGLLDSDAVDEDVDDDRVYLGSGFDPSTLIADLKAGSFDTSST